VALNLISLRGIALRAEALDVLYCCRAAEVEGEFMVVVDKLGLHAAALTDEVVARVDGPLDVFGDAAARLR
jgi:hypothetical protein